MNHAHKLIWLAVGLNLLPFSRALAGPPFVTDDPEPVDYQHWEFYVASQDSKLAGDWSGTGPHLELSYGINDLSGSKNWEFVGGVLQKQVLPNLALGAEVYYQTGYQTDFPNTATAFNVGLIYDFSERQHLLLSAGRSIDGPVDFQCYLAHQFTFDNSLFHLWSHSR